MSNSVYPNLPGLMLPVGRSVVPPPVQIRTTPSRREFRARDATLNRYRYSLPYEFLRTGRAGTELATLVGFYSQHGGPFESWLFDDPDDNTATSALFGAGDGVTSQYRLLRPFGGFAEPVDAVVASAKIFVNGLLANLVVNGGFVATALPWALGSGTHTAAVNNAGFAGLQLTNATGGADSFHAQVFPCAPSTTYTVTAKLFVDSVIAGAIENRSLLLTDGVGAVAGDYTLAPGHTTGVFVDKTVTITTGPSASLLQVRLYAPRGVVYWDEVRAAEGAVIPTMSTDQAAQVAWTSAQVTVTPAAPALASLTWSGKFYRRCRFEGDQLDTERFMQDLFSAKAVKFVSTDI